MAASDISELRYVTSGVIKAAEKGNSRVTNPLGSSGEGDSFSDVFEKVKQNIYTTNSYLSDAENEEIRWALGETESTHDLAIALQKAQTALQYTVTLRDRVIAAYRELIQMQI